MFITFLFTDFPERPMPKGFAKTHPSFTSIVKEPFAILGVRIFGTDMKSFRKKLCYSRSLSA